MRDTGVGILYANQSLMFRPFTRFAETQHLDDTGIGLGLFMCKVLVEKLNGSISFKAGSVSGCTFTFEVEAHRVEQEQNSYEEINS